MKSHMQRHNKILKLSLIAILFLSFALQSEAKVRLPKLVSDGMILQRDQPVKIWGWADASENITVTFLGKTYKTKADKTGNWSVTLPAQQAGGGTYEIQVNNITIKDILFGDIWLSSGQSNMELPIRRTLDLFADEVKNANNPHIRFFRVPMHYNFNEAESDCKSGEWKPVTPANIMEFSATAYFFAKDLHDKYKVPIGILSTAIGGTPAEAWISAETLKKYPSFEAEAKRCADTGFIEETRKQEQKKNHEWYMGMLHADKGISKWHKENIDISGWKDYYLPGMWKEKGVDIKRGILWLRKEFNVSKEDTGKSATLRLGYIIDSDSAFVNGKFVGTTGYQYPPRIYKVPQGVLKEGKNTVAIRIVTNEWGGIKEDKPYKIILDNKEIDLTGIWKYRVGAELPPSPAGTAFQYKPMGLYNGMIAPLTNYKIKGVIWYQGESNAGRAKEYTRLFQDLIQDWRAQRNEPELPFIYAQLPELNKPSRYPSESGLAELREAQRLALKLPYTGMAVTLGLGEWNDIHPQNKKDVGRLLAMEAQRVAYGDKDIVSTGPQLEGVKIDENSIVLTFVSVGSGLYSNEILNGFMLAGADKKYVWADAVVIEPNKVKVWSNRIQQPLSVRYAWADNPQGANLKNKEGLFASPFQAEYSDTIISNKSGMHDGFGYELWHDKGDVSMILKEGGAFECNWDNINNALFRTGKKFDSTKTHDQIGTIFLDYSCDYQPDGNSYLCVYGWSVDPLVEFYIVEAWGSWRPPGAEPKGTVEIGGSMYDIYETTRVEQPSIEGDTTFQQYWSVRTNKKTEGTIPVSEHFKVWEKMGMKLGKIYEVAFCVEGYQSKGKANLYKHRLTVGDTVIGK
ncbi:sialate O-acetylesterase [Dysgonomonas sp. PFB1-18]|uniref:glycoside hydrolase family 11 protein n=1 Tax=unclassified Dysgonomonas TaxID=2630389 RepID=UPI0024732ADF|nr:MULTISPECIES: glycoside hydrolase family 11 protein [unclassified Dysgonomonas]MDH6309933.1 sialate O-acetylesterase [Dysgonomonas sp. PF1-14]MDH6339476.1 sialate O-acetylesterase [Dysgonomonas sp. PF1-16]MDH6380977.1 sialate O-acetylesterase [Dysgonomonas sp. PFB1-18]MDH6397986.1 sialate O-acetylesterase [Dysgonomonas sp. PF1-23]